MYMVRTCTCSTASVAGRACLIFVQNTIYRVRESEKKGESKKMSKSYCMTTRAIILALSELACDNYM